MTPVYAVLVAVGSAFLFALAEISHRNGLRFASPAMSSILTVGVQWLIYTVAVLAFADPSAFTLSGSLWFLAAGLMNPCLFLTFFLLGIQRIGVARSSPIKGSAPIFSVLFALAFLGERLRPLQYLAIALVIGGILVISTEGLARRPLGFPAAPLGRGRGENPAKAPARKIDYVFPLLAGVAAGAGSVLFKVSLGKMPFPLLGAWLGTSMGFLLFPLLAFFFPREGRYHARPAALPWVALAGLCSSAALYGLILAIGLGQVSIVFTLNQTSPLFVLLLSVFFLRQLERVTPRVAFGAALTVSGGVLVSLL
ncbi:MAG: EamA family transporter [Candidatus Tectomicrobia bacterium]|nr:EamA family transporter [Candidatus Tectomicrobia bacterium]